MEKRGNYRVFDNFLKKNIFIREKLEKKNRIL